MPKRKLGLCFVLAQFCVGDPLGFESQKDFDFPETEAERKEGWSLADRKEFLFSQSDHGILYGLVLR